RLGRDRGRRGGGNPVPAVGDRGGRGRRAGWRGRPAPPEGALARGRQGAGGAAGRRTGRGGRDRRVALGGAARQGAHARGKVDPEGNRRRGQGVQTRARAGRKASRRRLVLLGG